MSAAEAHDYVLVIDRSDSFRSLLKQTNHAKFEINWIRSFIEGLRCRDVSLNEITTVTIVVYAGKAKYVSRYVPGFYAAGSSSDQQHYWELLAPTLLDDLTDKDLDRLLKKFMSVTSKLFVEEYGQLNLVLQDLSLDGYIRIKRRRFKLFLKRLSMTVTTTTIRRTRVLIVITGGRFSHVDCHLDNPFKNRDFSGEMAKKTSSGKSESKLAWKSNSCIVAKAAQYSYDYVFISVVGRMEEIQIIKQELELVWSSSTIILVSLTGNNYETIDIAEDLVYQIIDPCRALSSSSSSASISIAEPPKNDERVRAGGVSARKCTLIIAIDESDSFNRKCRGESVHTLIRNWINDILRQGKNHIDLPKFKAIVVRFSGLNVSGEENEIGSQRLVHPMIDNLYHYELAPQNRNGTLSPSSRGGKPYVTDAEIGNDVDIFDPVSEELDGNSQFYLCIRDICHYLDGAPELKNDNKALLVISDMNFDGIGDDMSETRPLKDKSHSPIDFTTMKEKLEFTFDDRIVGLQVNTNETFQHCRVGTLEYNNLETVFSYDGSAPDNIFHMSFNKFEDQLNRVKDKITGKLFEFLAERDSDSEFDSDTE